MTLRAKIDETELARNQEMQLQETFKVNQFADMIKNVRKYLCLQNKKFFYRRSSLFVVGVPVIIAGDTKNDTPYINIFRNELEKTISSWNENTDEYYDSIYKDRVMDNHWWTRFESDYSERDLCRLQHIIEKLNRDQDSYDLMYRFDCYAWTTPLKHYIIFWNLFLAAMDDDIYNEQLATVAELAACFGFDEPMMRDWCRAVEYVFAGNKLSEDCDLECETVEGARFFLHKEE